MNNSKYNITLKEKCCLLVENTLDTFLKVPAFQRYVNRKATSKYGINFSTHDGSTSEIDDVFLQYRFYDIQKNDVVLDIGANVGAFSIFMSKMVKHVFAVEPMLTDILRQNVKLNNVNNITVLDEALGKGIQHIKWSGCEDRIINGKSLSELIYICRNNGKQVTFLKMDCEGAEWCIKPEELNGIRRIEAEIHNFDGTHNLSEFLYMLDEAKFKYDFDAPRNGIIIVHAWR